MATCERPIAMRVSGTGIYLPAALIRGDDSLWTFRPAGDWAINLHRRVAIDGSSSVVVYETANTRLRVHDHRVALAGAPARHRLRAGHEDRLEFSAATHTLILLRIQNDGTWQDFDIGGVRDLVLRLGYGIDHTIAPRFSLGWQVRPGFAWVFLDTQRLLHVATRATLRPRPNHELALTLGGHLVHRDESQFGAGDLDRVSLHGEAGLAWSWLSRRGVGLTVAGRGLSSLFSGEAPLYEVRSETLRTPYAELTAGVLAAW